MGTNTQLVAARGETALRVGRKAVFGKRLQRQILESANHQATPPKGGVLPPMERTIIEKLLPLRYTVHMVFAVTDKNGQPLTPAQTSQKVQNRAASIWLEFMTGFLWWGMGEVPFHHIRRFFYRASGMHIGNGSTIHMRVRTYDPRHIVIGNDSIIGEQSVLNGRAKLHIGDHVDIATRVLVFNSQHDVHAPDFHPLEKENVIEDY